MKELWEPEALIGLKQIEAGRFGSERRFGSEANKASRRAVYVDAFEKELAAGHSRMRAYEAVARRFGKSGRTIERAVSAKRSQ